MSAFKTWFDVTHQLPTDAFPHGWVAHIKSHDDWTAGQKWETEVKIIDQKIVGVLKQIINYIICLSGLVGFQVGYGG